MTDVVSLNKQVFGTNVLKGGISRRAKRAMAEPLQVTAGIEMTYDDCECIDGGGRIRLGVKFTFGAVVGASIVSSVVGYLSGYCVTKAAKFGSLIGGFWGGVIGFAVGALLSWGIAKAINNAVYAGTDGPKEITLIDINTGIFGKSLSYYYDLGNLLGIVIGGGIGFGAAYVLGSAHAFATAY